MTDWIEWNGGECPVGRGVLIDIRDADGFVWENVKALDDHNIPEMWEHRDAFPTNNIVAYRLVDAPRASTSALSAHPGGTHYSGAAIQPAQFITANSLQFLEGCIVKRAFRHDKPTGKGREDVEKIIHEAQLLLELKYGVAA